MDPAQRAAYLAQRKLSVRAELADLRQWMEISDEKFEQLIELHANQGAEAREGAHLPQEQRTLMQQRHEGEIKEFLGADGYKKRQEWAAASWPRMWVDSLNAQLPEGSRVDANGKYRVAQAMAKAQARLHAEHMASEAVLPTANDIASRMAKNDRSLDLNRRVREAVRSAAIPHLSGQQMTALDSVLETHYRVAEEMYERKRAQLRASGN